MPAAPQLPSYGRLPINRCNLPAAILGSLTFQRHPAPLKIDGVEELHSALFEKAGQLPCAEDRARYFTDYMVVHFRLQALEEAGLMPDTSHGRPKANYLRLLRGWMFDPDSREGAVLKGWVESRFGLLPRYHKEPIRDPNDEAYRHYLQDYATGLYNTNALEAQLDLLYAYGQYELARRCPGETHISLYRGVNGLPSHDWLQGSGEGSGVVLLNNINSFSSSVERAEEFGALILQAQVPLAKVFFFSGLLPGLLSGEDEYMVIGGLYAVDAAR